MKARDTLVALFGRAGNRRAKQGRAAMPASSRRAKGTRAPALRLGLAAVIALLAILGVATATADTAPTPSIEAPSEVEASRALLKGHVNPNGGPSTTNWHFEYRLKDEAGENWNSGPGGEFTPDPPEELAKESVPLPVQAELEGLTPGTEYLIRLVASNEGGENSSSEEELATDAVVAPTPSAVAAEGVEYTRAKATGEVELQSADPAFNASCRFEYVTQAEWEANSNAFPAEGAPSEGCTAEVSGAGKSKVEAQLANLKPKTTYHLRLVASNQAGSGSAEAPATFETEEVTAPSVTTPIVSGVTSDSAHFKAEVSPNAPGAAPQDPGFDTHWEFVCAPIACGNLADTIAGDDQSHFVEANAALQPNIQYTVTVIAKNAGGEDEASESFETEAIAPEVAPQVSTPEGEGEVTIRGFVTPHNSPSVCHFDYGTSESYGQSAPCPAITGNGVQAITVTASAGQYTLSFGGQTTADIDFNAPASVLQERLEALASIGAGNVSVSGGPGSPSGESPYRVTFTGALGAKDVEKLQVGSGATPFPPDQPGAQASVLTVGGLNIPISVSAQLSGLQPGATYHYRLVANNGVGGDVETGDGTFFSPAAPSEESCPNAGAPGTGALPDCRAYEMASPPAKNGGNIMANPSRVRTAVDGNAVAFPSLSAFGDAVGTGISVDYIAERSAGAEPGNNGWATHAITPRQDPLPFGKNEGFDPVYIGDFSPDLSKAVVRAWSPVTADPDVAKVANFYSREDLLSPGSGNYRLITACPLCAATGKPLLPLSNIAPTEFAPKYGGASADFQHIAFGSKYNLTQDAPAQPALCVESPAGPLPTICRSRAYESDGGALRLAGRIPNGSETSCDDRGGPGCVPAQASIVGAVISRGFFPPRPLHVVSNDGSRTFFTVPTDGEGNVSPDEAIGKLFARIDGVRTVQLNASERTDCAQDPTCGGDGIPDPAPTAFSQARYWTASADGSRVFFTTLQELTDSTPGDERGNPQLYMYDTSKPASDPHNLTLVSESSAASRGINFVAAVVAASNDGSYVYFIDLGQLVPGSPPLGGKPSLFSWHEGHVSYVGDIHADPREYEQGGNITGEIQARITPDGSGLVFVSDGEVYLFRANRHELTCASCDPGGAAMSGARVMTADHTGASSRDKVHLSRAISDDGRYVFFTSPASLLSEDTNGKIDVYEFDTRTNELHLISSGTSSDDSYFMETSPSGRDVFFTTSERLSGWDTDTSVDLYDARIDGGFPEPPALTAPCSGDSCRGAGPATPGAPAAGSAAFSGPGNAKPRPCPKGGRPIKAKQGKTRCAKRKRHSKHKTHKHKNHKRAANANRRAGR